MFTVSPMIIEMATLMFASPRRIDQFTLVNSGAIEHQRTRNQGGGKKSPKDPIAKEQGGFQLVLKTARVGTPFKISGFQGPLANTKLRKRASESHQVAVPVRAYD